MKTPMQELMDEFAKKADSLPDTLDANVAYLIFQECYDMAKSMLEQEKEVMCDFVEYCDEANRNYQETEESWCEDLTIDDMFDKRFNTKEK
jgi:hypothetical protein